MMEGKGGVDEQGVRRRSRFPGWEVGPVAVGLGLVAHLVSGGASPVALAALLSMCASLVARLNFPNWLLLVFCGVSQQVPHLAFERFSGTFFSVVPAQHQHADDPSGVDILHRAEVELPLGSGVLRPAFWRTPPRCRGPCTGAGPCSRPPKRPSPGARRR
jgi:hypothetical protein